ncbi:MAG: PhnD/SsuA/transferrin family substrate-binding protein, partial [Anaerolineae bacterium]|nr:PhnD/SsuA/transferrin family substrate-binding protein [Anaerolineae bacterium]
MAREMRIFVMLILMSITTMAQAERVIRIGLTPVFLDDQVQVLRDWRAYLETRLGNPVQFVQRQTYREITDLLLQGELDAAWLCGFPYVRNRDRLTLLAVPVYRNQPLYESYLIVSAD